MAVKVLELHHHGIRVDPSPDGLQKALAFYRDVLGLSPDGGRPEIPPVPGYWMDVAGTAQIHLMGVTGTSGLAKAPDKDPSRPHVALAVPDVREAKNELDRMGVAYWTTLGVTGPDAEQVFMYDPSGNLIELHQAGTCRCNKTARPAAGGMS